MGQANSKQQQRVSGLLDEIKSLQSLLAQQRAKSDEAVATLKARVEELEKSSEELLQRVQAESDAKAAAAEAPKKAEPEIVADRKSALSEDHLEISIIRGVPYDMGIELGEKVLEDFEF
jgi:hypothetical protein